MSRLFDILHLKFPAPQIESKTCSLEETAGEQSKWQIALVQWQKPYRGGCATLYGVAAGGAGLKSVPLFSRSPLGDSKGCSPWRIFAYFLYVRK